MSHPGAEGASDDDRGRAAGLGAGAVGTTGVLVHSTAREPFFERATAADTSAINASTDEDGAPSGPTVTLHLPEERRIACRSGIGKRARARSSRTLRGADRARHDV